MNNYPEWKKDHDPVSHLLFDIGYSYALLQAAQKLLGKLLGRDSGVLPASLKLEAEEILEALRGFKMGRLALVGEIYGAAP
jgi:hypothetical protein